MMGKVAFDAMLSPVWEQFWTNFIAFFYYCKCTSPHLCRHFLLHMNQIPKLHFLKNIELNVIGAYWSSYLKLVNDCGCTYCNDFLYKFDENFFQTSINCQNERILLIGTYHAISSNVEDVWSYF